MRGWVYYYEDVILEIKERAAAGGERKETGSADEIAHQYLNAAFGAKQAVISSDERASVVLPQPPKLIAQIVANLRIRSSKSGSKSPSRFSHPPPSCKSNCLKRERELLLETMGSGGGKRGEFLLFSLPHSRPVSPPSHLSLSFLSPPSFRARRTRINPKP